MSLPIIYSAIPQYFGGKRALLPFVFNPLKSVIPQSEWQQLRFIDAFRGGGIVSLYAKSVGFAEVISNDISLRSEVVAKALLENNHTKIQPYDLMDFFSLSQLKPGHVETHYAGQVFSLRHARRLDQLRGYIESIQCPTKQSLFRLLLWKLTSRYVAYGTSIGISNKGCARALDTGDYHKLTAKRLVDGSFERLLKPSVVDIKGLADGINQGVFPALGTVKSYKLDVFELLSQCSGDIAYFDPPYAQTIGYEDSNKVLDDVLFGPNTGSLPVSPFTKSLTVLSDMFDQVRHVPVWMLSYNDRVCSLETLTKQIQSVDPTRKVKGFSKAYRHMQHVSKRENHEFLIISYQ